MIEDLEPPIIHKTRDYDQFKIIKWNREISHMGHLSRCISQNNKLYLHPIIVNEDMEVIDGQHRLEYAKSVGCPIYYVIDHYYKKMDLGNHNIASTVWKTSTFCDYFTKVEDDEFDDKYKRMYCFINKMKDLYKLDTAAFLHCFGRSNRKEIALKFRQGKIDIIYSEEEIEKKIEGIYRVLSIAKDLGVKGSWKKTWWKTLLLIFSKEGFDLEHFIQKMEMNPDAVIRAFRFYSMEDIQRILVDEVYNKGIRLNRLER